MSFEQWLSSSSCIEVLFMHFVVVRLSTVTTTDLSWNQSGFHYDHCLHGNLQATTKKKKQEKEWDKNCHERMLGYQRKKEKKSKSIQLQLKMWYSVSETW